MKLLTLTLLPVVAGALHVILVVVIVVIRFPESESTTTPCMMNFSNPSEELRRRTDTTLQFHEVDNEIRSRMNITVQN